MTDKLREQIDELLRSEMVTIGIDIDDAKTGQMWAYDSERLSKRIIALIIEILEKQVQLLKESDFAEIPGASEFRKVQLDGGQFVYENILRLIRKMEGGG